MNSKVKFTLLGILTVIISVFLLIIFASCGNKTILDTKYNFNYAYVKWPDGTSEKLELKSWTDYEDGEQIQITTKDNKTYLFSSYNCVLGTE